jgi:hypothetical protein
VIPSFKISFLLAPPTNIGQTGCSRNIGTWNSDAWGTTEKKEHDIFYNNIFD